MDKLIDLSLIDEMRKELWMYDWSDTLEILEHWEPAEAYSIQEVAKILADVFDDTCACNINGNDEWLPQFCQYEKLCPNPGGVKCWEQFLRHKHKQEIKTET